MTKDEALKLALEFLERPAWRHEYALANINQASTVLKEALAQPEQEPVALPCCGYADASAIKWNPHNQVVQCHNCGQIYTATPQRTWVELTDEDWDEIFGNALTIGEAIKVTEAKLKQKNGYAEENT